jgi:sulfite reductase (NADPH) flavoprotein alpha-component
MTTTATDTLKAASLAATPVLPDTAPFTAAQRTWLNGFFAGLMSGGAEVGAPAKAAGPVGVAAVEPTSAPAVEELPWHDPSLPLAERMKLAEGKPRNHSLMAAMAQLDCGACGYACKTYAEALDRGEERDATRCTPGGAETAKKLKELLATLPPAPAGESPPAVRVNEAPPAPPAPSARPSAKPFVRDNPFPARLREATRLNLAGSEKDTRHIVLDLAGSGLSYKPGDALGVHPENCPTLVEHLLDGLDASGAEDVVVPNGQTLSLREAMLRHCNVTRPTPMLYELLGIKMPEDGDDRQVLDLLMSFEARPPKPALFIECLAALQPRLYSIASSLLAHPDQVHLTVGVVRYVGPAGRGCKGVCSTYLAERIRPGQKVRVFVHPSSRFGLPASAEAPVIMVGPGTGVAPFRAFLQHRKAARHTGRNWLFFGDQRSRFDFLYEREMKVHLADGSLTRLDTAFSRDADQKLYVQHRMIEHAAELWKWLEAGAHFYVCGDAKRMAADVDQTLRAVVAEQSGMGGADADAYVTNMSKTGRYQRDVY